jgi:AcrR family transcriptional regulator
MESTHGRGSARERVLDAARRVFAQSGSAGATTRRIAEEAGVNEVTVFRHFGSKEALLDEAARTHATGEHALPLPENPKRPQAELTQWCATEIERLRSSRDFILQCLAEGTEHPGIADCGAVPLTQGAAELRRYVDRLHQSGRIRHTEDREAATTMLLATMYSDALGRTALPEVHVTEPARAPALYVRIFLRALGVRVATET